MPVTGTHAAGEPCATCQRTPTRVLASSFPLGRLVRWPTNGGRGHSHGRVVAQGRTRVQVFWHTARPRPTWIAAKRLQSMAGMEHLGGCGSCAGGR